MQTLTLKKNIRYDENNNEIFEEKIYTAVNPRAIIIRQALQLKETIDESNITLKDFDLLINFVVNLFGNKFTDDDVWNGIDYDKIGITLLNCINGIISDMNGHMSKIPNA